MIVQDARNCRSKSNRGLGPAASPSGRLLPLTIFGASGDLARRKLIPSLYNLACVGCMTPDFEVLGIGRTPMSDEEFRAKMREAASKSKDTRDFSDSGWQEFENRLHYLTGDIDDPQFYNKLRDRLNQMRKGGSSPNRLFYLSTPASEAPYDRRRIGRSRSES